MLLNLHQVLAKVDDSCSRVHGELHFSCLVSNLLVVQGLEFGRKAQRLRSFLGASIFQSGERYIDVQVIAKLLIAITLIGQVGAVVFRESLS